MSLFGLYASAEVIKKTLIMSAVVAATVAGVHAIPYLTPRRKKLNDIFLQGELYATSTRFGKPVRRFPEVEEISYSVADKRTDIKIKIPFGLDPQKVQDKVWMFEQMFGQDISLEKLNASYFNFSIYDIPLPDSFEYCYEEVYPVLLGKQVPIFVGRSHSGLVAYDMAEYPHLIVAGETGSGKSTQLRSILTSLIQFKSPDDLQLFLGDLKKAEFHLFKRCKHTRRYAVTAGELLEMLREVSRELMTRTEYLDQYEVTHVNQLPFKLPSIIVCIDEVALLKKDKDIMSKMSEIGTIGRALGVYLILSMQRPDSDVIEGGLKNNLTVRMAFRHADQINYRITLGTEAPVEISHSQRGRMWLKQDSLRIVQAPLLESEEAKKLLTRHYVYEGE